MTTSATNGPNAVSPETTGAAATSDDAGGVPSILLVDDEPSVLSALRRVFRPAGYEILTAESGEAALEVLASTEVDLIVSDMRMPGMSGAEFLARARSLYPDTMRILLTGYAEIASVVQAVNDGGVYRYLNKPWDDHDLLLTLEQALEQRRLRREAARLAALTEAQNEALRRFNTELETQVRARTEELGQTVMFLEAAQRDLKSSFTAMVQVCASMIEIRCGSASGHAMRVGEIARRLALNSGMSELHAQDVYFAGLLHGIGKLSLPDELLRKPLTKMTAEEHGLYLQHPLRAQMVLTPVAQLHKVASIVLHQYERFNGRGTPDGLAGDAIPLGSRILAIARDFEGLRNGDIGAPHSVEQALDALRSQAGVRYDPRIVDGLNELMRDPASLGIAASVAEVKSAQLREGMQLADDLRTHRGVLLMTKGSVMSAHQIELVRRFETREGTSFDILVLAGQAAAKPAQGAPNAGAAPA
ncbi:MULTISPECIES: HD domain-containing phosphohydrolase [Burkholderia]|jgi:response regulator RpfG family c-di-GMP phosphodiesterase|uniref:Response regulator n=2 Tax=Burkholderia contaminans TaxID=488447 RepID=A0A1E3FKH7_9BURK|nr:MULTISPECIES: HD domain-containing phosphohydrolase [Burkholderia]UTP27518.1 response regulator [Burkholderia sp. FXe9]KKL42160.1 chemotaxis protein CheY [Burkholderia contaminans LMG 23361]MBA9829111.1 two-component system response regulator [Burkholderia contaminans]MBA9837992.1 two-component system response regulator [Burkholderia contaminans]MBA9862529.1 two-component system response regulator [Burkholderia contaminans]